MPKQLAFPWQVVHLVEPPLGPLLRVQSHQLGHLVTYPIREVMTLPRIWEHLPQALLCLPHYKVAGLHGWPCWTGWGKEFEGLERGQDIPTVILTSTCVRHSSSQCYLETAPGGPRNEKGTHEGWILELRPTDGVHRKQPCFHLYPSTLWATREYSPAWTRMKGALPRTPARVTLGQDLMSPEPTHVSSLAALVWDSRGHPRWTVTSRLPAAAGIGHT